MDIGTVAGTIVGTVTGRWGASVDGVERRVAVVKPDFRMAVFFAEPGLVRRESGGRTLEF
jgi:hypothetical protein